jgi:hypothetical protein
MAIYCPIKQVVALNQSACAAIVTESSICSNFIGLLILFLYIYFVIYVFFSFIVLYYKSTM